MKSVWTSGTACDVNLLRPSDWTEGCSFNFGGKFKLFLPVDWGEEIFSGGLNSCLRCAGVVTGSLVFSTGVLNLTKSE